MFQEGAAVFLPLPVAADHLRRKVNLLITALAYDRLLRAQRMLLFFLTCIAVAIRDPLIFFENERTFVNKNVGSQSPVCSKRALLYFSPYL